MPGRKRFSVYWAKNAELDLSSIIDYIADENINSAERILDKIQKTARRLALFPKRGRIVPELKEQGILVYHEMIYSPWRIIYRIESHSVWVMAVIDSRRDLADLLLQRFIH